MTGADTVDEASKGSPPGIVLSSDGLGRLVPKRTVIWNNGGGTQSAAIAALIVAGKLPKPDLAVIADTGRERSSTWDYMERHIIPALASVGVTMHRASKDKYATKDLFGGKDGKTLLIPAYTSAGGDVGKLSAFCSSEWKRAVVQRWAREEHGVSAATSWIGYSSDELGRALKAQQSEKAQGKWQLDFPLLRLGMNRGNCAHLALEMFGEQPPRSSCWMCSNMHMREWREVMADPRDRVQVIRFDRELRQRDPHAWLTEQCVPIEEADFSEANEVLFGRDAGGCDSGMCFV